MSALTDDTLTYGTVFVFTEDLTYLTPRWASRRPGVHFIVGGLSDSGYTFSAYNTATGRRDDIMAEPWVFKRTRVIGTIPADGEPADETGTDR
jgi:hypothetical protein